MVKNLPARAGDTRDTSLIPGDWEDPLEKENGNPLQYSCLKNSMDKRSLAGYSSWGRKEMDMTDHTHTHIHTHLKVLRL